MFDITIKLVYKACMRDLSELSEIESGMAEHLAQRADQIFNKILRCGPQQVRFDGSRILSFKYPAPRGYGVRGVLVGIYRHGVKVRWICDDLIAIVRANSNEDSHATSQTR